MLSKTVIALGVLSAADLVAGHCAMVGVAGSNGITGMGLNIVPGVNRKSQIPTQPSDSPNNPEADTTVFGHPADMCGKTAIAGDLMSTSSIMSAISKMASMASGLPTVEQGSQLMTTMHIVNADGNPNYMADIDTTGTGSNFQSVNIVSGGTGAGGILGDQGLAFDIANMPMNSSVVVQMPNSPCTGTAPDGTQGMCLLRVYNNAAAGGFGGCTAVIMGSGSSSNSSSSDSSTSSGSTDSGSSTDSSSSDSGSSDAKASDSKASNSKESKRMHARQLLWV